MTIGSLLSIAVGAILKLSATVEVAGVELGTLEIVLVILAVIVALGLGLYSLWVLLFFIGAGR